MINYIKIHPEVQHALENNLPVVALESTIISHGMPWPQNAITAKSVEAVVRAQGAIPATIAIKDGCCLVGLSSDDIDYFGQTKGVWKVSLRDMPYVIANKLPGATTVAATMRIAAMAGIRIFATGGIGGVHRGAETTMDISADLTEMAQTNVAVVAAGVKSILDIGLTLEYLETMGVPVVTYGQDEFPSFYSSKSGFASPLRLDTPLAFAQLLKAKWDLGLNGSVLIANPIPAKYEMEPTVIEQHIQQALADAAKQNIKGKEVTPFILQHIASHTQGESLEANIALIKNNAKVASEIAKEL
ncbi:pseudouridine-5'-phosphate glycosidase [Flavobacterium paronense]|uniref:Pseudouridine-5'-phosphate glycosidase n=1 Tax=Flavobacterium paronense TaxID=1392775 RepID=A0ABV5GCN5_9FLAO|nr:pseudouridine-5'-phosphate glycosidase [Flavobacterium paronense]MDN3676298.1 pseudouridine-5'-phosphate glycosidase [Flavobacterium paronense]